MHTPCDHTPPYVCARHCANSMNYAQKFLAFRKEDKAKAKQVDSRSAGVLWQMHRHSSSIPGTMRLSCAPAQSHATPLDNGAHSVPLTIIQSTFGEFLMWFSSGFPISTPNGTTFKVNLSFAAVRSARPFHPANSPLSTPSNSITAALPAPMPPTIA